MMEILIVVSIIGVISAITLPNVMSLRRSGMEAQASRTLGSEIQPAMVSYKAQAVRDADRDGIGDYPVHVSALAGIDSYATPIEASGNLRTHISSMSGEFADFATGTDGTTTVAILLVNGSQVTTTRAPSVGGYTFGLVLASGTGMQDTMITAIATPVEGGSGERAFGVSLNPSYLNGLWVETKPSKSSELKFSDLATPGNMFTNPAGTGYSN